MRTLIITTLAVGLIGCASKPQVVQIVDPYTYTVYDLTDAPCPYKFEKYPYAFTYKGTVQGCFNTSSARQGIEFISARDWRTEVFYSYSQLTRAKNQYVAMDNQVVLSTMGARQPSAPSRSIPIETSPSFPQIQCFSNGFGTVTCN